MAQGSLCLIPPHPVGWLARWPGESPAVHRSPVCCSGHPRCWMLWDELSPNLLQTSGKPGNDRCCSLVPLSASGHVAGWRLHTTRRQLRVMGQQGWEETRPPSELEV